MKDLKTTRRQRLIIAASLAAVVVAFFGAVYQSFRYEELSLQVSSLEKIQNEKIEQNKQSIASISVLSAPARIDALAKQDPALTQGYPKDALIINASVPAAARPADPRGDKTSSAPSSAGPGSGSGSGR